MSACVELDLPDSYFVVGAQPQDPSLDPVRYLAEQAKPLGLIKRPRKPPKQKAQAPLDSA
ncbi:hypothetical protein [Allochromatium tepidum]|uniref:Transposase n=1 Tax=Allochromatium tepidum TaxID=553982 RepID=A0ABN6G967_9GAMM|nr:hypothetical protein [Allochromatium tepidum]BCU06506.1 hypothetical protein Atep_11830 [Allochromatium tepidum]